MKLLHGFGLALQFLTRLPLPRQIPYSPVALSWSVVFYPLVGLLIGLLLVLVRQLVGEAAPLLSAALVLTTWVLLTGGLHLDGLADCADAWVGGQGEREKSLRIMKDPYSGPIAVVALVLLLLVKFAALAELTSTAALLWVPVMGRSAIPLLLLTTPYVRHNGLGSPLVENLPRRSAWVSCIVFSLISLAFLGPIPVLAAALAVYWLRFEMLRRLGGCTGDTLGASVEIVEAVVLMGAVLVQP
jgi:adenosylcobinamide-GDP ribazoletransferase